MDAWSAAPAVGARPRYSQHDLEWKKSQGNFLFYRIIKHLLANGRRGFLNDLRACQLQGLHKFMLDIHKI